MSGSPLIPPYMPIVMIGFFLLLKAGVFFIFKSFLNTLPVHHWRRAWVTVTLSLFFLFISAGLLALTSYFIYPSEIQQLKYDASGVLHISFTRPVNRKLLSPSISPYLPGRWEYSDPLYSTHAYRTLTFYPEYSPGTHTYTVTLTGISNFIRLTSPRNVSFVYTPSPAAEIASVDPFIENEQMKYVRVGLSQPFDPSEFNIKFVPDLPVDILRSSPDTLTVLPKKKPLSGVNYALEITRSAIQRKLRTGQIISRSNPERIYFSSLISSDVLGIESTSDFPLTVHFSDPMDKPTVEKQFSITPSLAGSFSWPDDRTMIFIPSAGYTPSTVYTYIIGKYAKTTTGNQLNEDMIRTFEVPGEVQISDTFPKHEWTGIAGDDVIKITFNQSVDHGSAVQHFAISPETAGNFSWNGNELVFTPQNELQFSTSYTVRVGAGVKGNFAELAQDYSFSFTTQDAVTKLPVPAYLQKYSLSCEIAALRMALAYRGIDVSEDSILEKVGQDSAPKRGDTWGNPYVGFVGNINGRQMVTGYGVHWEPVARAARTWRNAESFENWTIRQLTEAIQKGHPVVVWTYAKSGTPTVWFTPGEDKINAFRDEHAVTVAGYVGSPGAPSELIINDPLAGQVHWDREDFDKKWRAFHNSGVVVY